MAEFQRGDVVQLKSGGPKMTVSNVDEKGVVYVVWFPTDAKHEVAKFVKEALVK